MAEWGKALMAMPLRKEPFLFLQLPLPFLQPPSQTLSCQPLSPGFQPEGEITNF